MGRKVLLILSSVDRNELKRIVLRSNDWRQRQRSQTLLLLGNGFSLAEVADRNEIHVRTVGITRRDWLARKFDSLVDAPRSGAPSKLTPEEVNKVLEAARSEPLTAKTLLARHVENGGTLVHLNTLSAALKEAGFVWKRTRHSLKKKERE